MNSIAIAGFLFFKKSDALADLDLMHLWCCLGPLRPGAGFGRYHEISALVVCSG
jgi:hypothetical protein